MRSFIRLVPASPGGCPQLRCGDDSHGAFHSVLDGLVVFVVDYRLADSSHSHPTHPVVGSKSE